MHTPNFAHLLKQKKQLLGSWCTFASFASTEVMTELGFDFLVLDMQHCELTQSQFPSLLGAFPASGSVPIVRAPENNYHIINWLYDQGVGGVLVPMVNSPQQVQRVVEAAKFPPLGRRSFGPYRAARYSFGVSDYMPKADQLAALIIQLESEQAVEQVDDILQVPGIDAIFMGPNDLAFSMLRPGQSLWERNRGTGASTEGSQQWTAFARTPEVMERCEHVLKRAVAAGVPFGVTSGSMEEACLWLEKGARFATFGSDFLFIRAGAKLQCGMPRD